MTDPEHGFRGLWTPTEAAVKGRTGESRCPPSIVARRRRVKGLDRYVARGMTSIGALLRHIGSRYRYSAGSDLLTVSVPDIIAPVEGCEGASMGDERTRWLETAMGAAREAGKLLLRRLGDSREITYKGPGDIVTDADLAAQESILELIRAAYPDHAILSEEMASPEVEGGQPLWVVDPLDGTTNYSRRWPSFCVSIAVSENGRVMAGAVYDPNMDEMFHSYRGGGAFLNGVPLRVSSMDSLAGALMAMNWPYGRDAVIRTMRLLGCLMPRVGTMRSVGSAALSLCYVAAGRSDVYFHPSLYAWDVAAAGLILEEAGGTLTDLRGDPWTLQTAQCLGTNSLLLEEVVRLIADCR